VASATTTTDHSFIRQWAEDRGGRPAHVKGTGGPKDAGLLRIDFGDPEPSLEPISWEEFFEAFEANELAFLHQDETGGGNTSRFNKFVSRKDHP
jgi:hypothetical protein